MTAEAWKPYPLAPAYLVSDAGRIIGPKGNVLRQGIVSQGKYRGVSVHRKSQTVHRIVAETFLARPSDSGRYEVNHINGDKSDNRLANIQWCTRSQNVTHAYRVLGVKPNCEQARAARAKKLLAEQRTLFCGKVATLITRDGSDQA